MRTERVWSVKPLRWQILDSVAVAEKSGYKLQQTLIRWVRNVKPFSTLKYREE